MYWNEFVRWAVTEDSMPPTHTDGGEAAGAAADPHTPDGAAQIGGAAAGGTAPRKRSASAAGLAPDSPESPTPVRQQRTVSGGRGLVCTACSLARPQECSYVLAGLRMHGKHGISACRCYHLRCALVPRHSQRSASTGVHVKQEPGADGEGGSQLGPQRSRRSQASRGRGEDGAAAEREGEADGEEEDVARPRVRRRLDMDQAVSGRRQRRNSERGGALEAQRAARE